MNRRMWLQNTPPRPKVIFKVKEIGMGDVFMDPILNIKWTVVLIDSDLGLYIMSRGSEFWRKVYTRAELDGLIQI